jgi:signal transduction histidine kinase
MGAACSLAASVTLCALFYWFTRKRYKELAALSEQIDEILHGSDSIEINVFNEGELSILRDDIQKMTIRLREQADSLKRDKIFLSDSLADIAHQLRTPMTSIRMLVTFLSKTDLESGKRLEYSHDAETLLSRTDWLLSALLKISKIDAGTAVFRKESFTLNELLDKAVSPLEIPMEIRGVTLNKAYEGNISLSGDLNWTAEAVGNILKNCLEHSEPGGVIEITGTVNALFAELSIRDHGKGFDPEELPHLFERFYQGSLQKEGNFGVGLALSRKILSAQNGTVKAANHPQGGACFTVRFYLSEYNY